MLLILLIVVQCLSPSIRAPLSVPQHPSLSFHPPASVSHLTGADRAAITVQDPDLPAVLDLAVVDAVPGAVVSVGTAAVVASVQVEAHRVVGAGVPPRLAFVNICRGPPEKKTRNKKRTSHICLL